MGFYVNIQADMIPACPGHAWHVVNIHPGMPVELKVAVIALVAGSGLEFLLTNYEKPEDIFLVNVLAGFPINTPVCKWRKHPLRIRFLTTDLGPEPTHPTR